ISTSHKFMSNYFHLSNHFLGEDRHLSHTRYLSCPPPLSLSRTDVNNGKASCTNLKTARLDSLTVTTAPSSTRLDFPIFSISSHFRS
ncbi:uncharacterized protein J3R85_001747, partial [Psidium guajava]